MEVFLIRHATRNFTTGDVPLNAEGIAQANELCNETSLNGVVTLLSSPKKRAQMTLEPLSEKLKQKIDTLQELDQMERGETEESFRARVQRILDKIERGQWQTPLILCSHSDWLAIAMDLIPSDSTDLKYQMFHCCEYLRFSIEDGIWHLKD